MKGYKIFNSKWQCSGFQFEIGKTFKENIKPEYNKRGFHFCVNPIDLFDHHFNPLDYYFNPSCKIAEIEAIGNIDADDYNYNRNYCTDEIHIIRELTWQEILVLVNSGNKCTGYGNNGDYNSGHYNNGNYNSGNCNSGDRNSGNKNSGNYNSGDNNSGRYNRGDYNSGDYNRGHFNSGMHNTGNHNSGSWNNGSHNCGRHNNGDCNNGCWNNTNHASGCFNTEEQTITMFDKPSNWTWQDWARSEANMLLCTMPDNVDKWINADDMTRKEKKEHPEHHTTGGYLRADNNANNRQDWWNNLSASEKDIIKSMPNFDADKFKQCTGIDTN